VGRGKRRKLSLFWGREEKFGQMWERASEQWPELPVLEKKRFRGSGIEEASIVSRTGKKGRQAAKHREKG